VEIILLPSMALDAVESLRASVIVVADVLGRIPRGARHRFQIQLSWVSSKVLPVVSVDTGPFIMINVIEGAPYGLVVKKKEVLILEKIMNKCYHNIPLTMAEGAECSVFTFFKIAGIVWTELCFVLIRLVKLLDFIVAKLAVIALGTFLSFLNKFAKIWVVVVPRTSFVLLVVVEGAFLVGVNFF
jgi:hypothetical protein